MACDLGPTGRTVDGFQGDLERNLLWNLIISTHQSRQKWLIREFSKGHLAQACIFCDLVSRVLGCSWCNTSPTPNNKPLLAMVYDWVHLIHTIEKPILLV